MQYAQTTTRVMQPISNLKHAIALLGMIRIFPVICISEMPIIKASYFAAIMLHPSKDGLTSCAVDHPRLMCKLPFRKAEVPILCLLYIALHVN